MSKFVCHCGHVISDVEYPSPVSGSILTEKAIARLIAASAKELADLLHHSAESRKEWVRSRFGDGYPADASDTEILEDLLAQQIQLLSYSTIRCDLCGRLHVQTQPGSNDYQSFIPEQVSRTSANE